jgi:hypothetical protein
MQQAHDPEVLVYPASLYAPPLAPHASLFHSLLSSSRSLSLSCRCPAHSPCVCAPPGVQHKCQMVVVGPIVDNHGTYALNKLKPLQVSLGAGLGFG